ncbi:hypothetical protein CC99x_002550 [Candidatus Berkiella cookevillensis]|uniref:Uncharacterized protein n=1 Tax=Candidatus Berkiella cookevillensis TaxID=437022 RepID=A0A0Q9YL75_9GAMM|nr:hypothetical protein [Candidatus Berkiella cookevillensis]MCS5707779.1 hypothetical protein [Candidatus Berkiella cookevillensis]
MNQQMIYISLGLLIIGLSGPILRFAKYLLYLRRVTSFKAKLENFSEMEEKISVNIKPTFILSPREAQYCLQLKCKKEYGVQYESLRTQVAEEIPGICFVASQIAINTSRQSYLALAVGGPIIGICIFGSALEDLGHVETKWQTRFDTLDKMIGILKTARASSFIQIFDPRSWLTSILRIPFYLLKATGFNIEKIEDSLLGHLFKAAFLIAIIMVLLKLGFTTKDISGFHL